MEPVESTAAPAAEPVAAAAEPAPDTTQTEVPAQTGTDTPPAPAAVEGSTSEAITTQPADNGAEENASSCTSGCNAGRNIGIVFVAVVVVVAILAAIFRRKGGKDEGEDDQKAAAASGKAVEIYVGNLSYAMNDDQLRKEFERFGVVKSARVIGHRASGKSKGYGFVEMPHRKEAEIAIKNLNNRDVMGRKLRVNEARRGIPKE